MCVALASTLRHVGYDLIIKILSGEGLKAMITVEEFCYAYRAQPDEAMASIKGFDDEKTAAILIDAGGVLSEISLLDDGISRLEEQRPNRNYS